MKTYKHKELLNLERLIFNANVLSSRDAQETHDQGTCVLGSGIALYVVPPRCRNAKMKVVVPGLFQGNVSNRKHLENALKYLQSNGVECFYFDGYID